MIKQTRLLAWFISTLMVSTGLRLAGCASNEPLDTRPALIKEADTLISKGVGYYNLEDYAKATSFFYRALHSYRAIDNPKGIASSCINMAKTRLAQGDINAATVWLDAAQNVIDNNELVPLEPRVTIIRSSIAIENNQLDDAKDLLKPFVEADPKSVDADTRRAATQNRTRIAFMENIDASVWTDRYAAVADVDNPLHQARLERFKAALAQDTIEADRHFAAALDLYREHAHRPGIAATLSEWAEVDIQREAFASAEGKFSRALFIWASMLDASETVHILEQLAELYTQTGNDKALETTQHWLLDLDSESFGQWQSLTESFSAFPVK